MCQSIKLHGHVHIPYFFFLNQMLLYRIAKTFNMTLSTGLPVYNYSPTRALPSPSHTCIS
jgi:hypothetical protein